MKISISFVDIAIDCILEFAVEEYGENLFETLEKQRNPFSRFLQIPDANSGSARGIDWQRGRLMDADVAPYSWKVRGQLITCIAVHKSAEPNSLLAKISPSDRDELLSAKPNTYYVTEHYVRAPVILVRLDQISSKALKSLL